MAVVVAAVAEAKDEEDEVVTKATTEAKINNSGVGKTAPPQIGMVALPYNAIATDPIVKPATWR